MEANVVQEVAQEVQQPEYVQVVKPTLWQRIKNSKLMRALTYITRIRITVAPNALPEGKN